VLHWVNHLACFLVVLVLQVVQEEQSLDSFGLELAGADRMAKVLPRQDSNRQIVDAALAGNAFAFDAVEQEVLEASSRLPVEEQMSLADPLGLLAYIRPDLVDKKRPEAAASEPLAGLAVEDETCRHQKVH
jgi:hypothetical protein